MCSLYPKFLPTVSPAASPAPAGTASPWLGQDAKRSRHSQILPVLPSTGTNLPLFLGKTSRQLTVECGWKWPVGSEVGGTQCDCLKNKSNEKRDNFLNKMIARGQTCPNSSFTAQSVHKQLRFLLCWASNVSFKKMLIMVQIQARSTQICWKENETDR